MVLSDYYDKLYYNSIEKIKSRGYKTDPLINSSEDNRRGVTLLIRPPLEIKNRIQEFLKELKKVDNEQYYYPNSDIHITVLSIISCYNGFRLEKISIPEYVKIIEKNIRKTGKFGLHFKGITASDSGVMIQGFAGDDILNNIRDQLRKNFKNSALEQSIDKRYTINTAHSTVVRFQKQLRQREEFLKILEKFRNYDFGRFQVDSLELVVNDWYQKEKNVKSLHIFKL